MSYTRFQLILVNKFPNLPPSWGAGFLKFITRSANQVRCPIASPVLFIPMILSESGDSRNYAATISWRQGEFFKWIVASGYLLQA